MTSELTAAALRALAEDREAIYIMHKAIEDVLIEWRDSRLSYLTVGNGFTIRESDGSPSDVIRLRVPDGLRIGLNALADHLDARG